MTPSKTSSPDVFLRKGVLKMGSKITGEHRCQSVISINCFSCWYILEAKIFQPKVCNFTKSNTIYGCFSRFLNCVNGIKLRNASQWSKLESYERYFSSNIIIKWSKPNFIKESFFQIPFNYLILIITKYLCALA